MIKAEDCTVGYVKTLTRKYRGCIVGPDDERIWTAKQRHNTPKEAKGFAKRVLSMNAVLTVKASENDK